MATTKSASNKATESKQPATKATLKKSAPEDATSLLMADHKVVSELFEEYEKARSQDRKASIVSQICQELTVHTQLEEEIFYPAVKAALKDREMVPEACVEHASVKDLIAQVQDQVPEGEMYDAKVKVMSEFVKHHVEEEETEMFPKARATKLDLVELGEQMTERKNELMAELA